MTTFTLRRNDALNPAAINPASGGADGWTTNRGFGGGAGSYSYGTSTGIPSPAGLVTFRRKQWSANGTAPGTAGFQVYATATTYHAVQEGDTICVSAVMRMIGSASTPKNFVVRLQFWDRTAVSGAVAVGATTVGTTVRAETYNVWYRLSQGILVPAGAKGVAIYVDTATSGDPPFMNGDGLDCTELLIERGTAVGTYFSGATAAAGGKSYRWTGAANASASEQTATTIPLPVAGDKMKDAALYIRNFAEAVDSALNVPIIVRTFDTGEKVASPSGYINAAAPSGIETIGGVVVGGAHLIDHQGNSGSGDARKDGFYYPTPVRDPNTGPLSFRMFNAPTNTVNSGRYQRAVGLVWGTPQAAGQQPAVNPAGVSPGSEFPRGVTPRGIRYPGTDEPQWQTAEFVQQLAEDIGAAIGGSPLGLTLAMYRGILPNTGLGTIKKIEKSFAGTLSRVRGAVATHWDSTGSPQTLNFTWYPLLDSNSPELKATAIFYVSWNQPVQDDGFNTYPGGPPLNNIGVSIIAWGDPA